jgi:hypothetical protein
VNTRHPIMLPGADSWGWATWADRWMHYEDDLHLLSNKLNESPARRHFNHGSQANWEGTLRLTLKMRRNSWAVRWRASIFLRNGHSVYPPYPMIRNIGHDGSGEHCTISNTYDCNLPDALPDLPHQLAFDLDHKNQLDAWHARHNSLAIRIRRRLNTMFLKILKHR